MRKQSFALFALATGILFLGAACSNTSKLTVDTPIDTMPKENGTATQQPPATGDAMVRTDETMTKDPAPKEDAMMKDKKPAEAMIKSGSYEDYSPDKLALAANGKVILFFKASWCPTCQAVDRDILAHVSTIPAGTHILKIDYDNSTELKKKYGVTYQHTFVQVDTSGTLLKKWSGSPTLASIINEIK